jgi:hypothetical protein
MCGLTDGQRVVLARGPAKRGRGHSVATNSKLRLCVIMREKFRRRFVSERPRRSSACRLSRRCSVDLRSPQRPGAPRSVAPTSRWNRRGRRLCTMRPRTAILRWPASCSGSVPTAIRRGVEDACGYPVADVRRLEAVGARARVEGARHRPSPFAGS